MLELTELAIDDGVVVLDFAEEIGAEVAVAELMDSDFAASPPLPPPQAVRVILNKKER